MIVWPVAAFSDLIKFNKLVVPAMFSLDLNKKGEYWKHWLTAWVSYVA
jgi:hypothetical protein